MASETANTIFAAPNGSSGTPSFRALAGADLPAPTISTLGGVEAISAVSHEWVNAINGSGVPQLSQPGFSDLSGAVAPSAQMPNSGATAGSYTCSNVTVTAQGLVSAASSGSCSGGGSATTVQSGTGVAVSGSPCTTTCTVSLSGIMVLNTRTVASGTSDTASATDYTVTWNSAATGAKTETVPNCSSGNKGQVMVIKDEAQNAATYSITVEPASAGTIEGAATAVITSNGAALTIQCDGGSNWNAI